MGYGIGKAPVKVGEEPTPETLALYEGSAPEDFQQWIWSLYRSEEPALVRGAVVTGRSDMSYDVSAGVAIFPAGDCRTIAVPFEATTVATADAPTSGTRKDYLYVTDDGAVQVKAGSRPAGSVALDVRSVPANITATTGTSSTYGNRVYAPLFGGAMGEMARWQHGVADLTPLTDARTHLASLTFTIDSDRRIQVDLGYTYEMSRLANTSEKYGWREATFLWEYQIDSEAVRISEFGVKDHAEFQQDIWTTELTAGTHTVDLYRTRRLQGTVNEGDYPMIRVGTSRMYAPTTLVVSDLGGTQ